MSFKINISEKTGKTYKLELENEDMIGKKVKDIINGKELSPELEGYEFEITGISDKSGFSSYNFSGIGLKKVLLTYGKIMRKKPRREGKKKLSNPKPKGLRLRKTIRGDTISTAISQINMKVKKQGTKKLSEIFKKQEKQEEKQEN